MKTAYTIYHHGGAQERGEIDWPDEPGYDRIKKLVEPLIEGPIEHVTVLDPSKIDADEIDPRADRRDLFVDELGHVRKTGPKPRNDAATTIYRANWMRMHPTQDPESLPFIAGTAVLFDRIVWL
jgi:hypothetical protein